MMVLDLLTIGPARQQAGPGPADAANQAALPASCRWPSAALQSASPDIKSDNTILAVAVSSTNQPSRLTPLHIAAMQPSGLGKQRLRRLLDNSTAAEISAAEISAADEQGNTPLHYAFSRACLCGSVDSLADTVAMLLEAGADPNACNSKGHTALHMAAASDCQPDVQRQLVQLLLRHHAAAGMFFPASIQDAKGNTALHFAAAGSTTDVLQLLLSASASASTPNRAGQTALDIAVKHGRAGNCRRLLARIAGDGAPARDALVAAAGSGQLRIVRLLLKHGGVPSEFALAAAAAKNHTAVLSLLLEALPQASARAAARAAAVAAAYAGQSAALELLVPHAAYRATKLQELRDAARCCYNPRQCAWQKGPECIML